MNRKHILVTVLLLALLLGQICAFPVFAEQTPAVENGLPVLYVNVDETAFPAANSWICSPPQTTGGCRF